MSTCVRNVRKNALKYDKGLSTALKKGSLRLNSYFMLFQGVLCPGYVRRPSGGESLGLNRLSGEGVNLVADWANGTENYSN